MSLSFRKLFYVLASVMAIVAILYIGKNLLIPVIFALLFAFILYPIVKWLRNKRVGTIWAILITLIGVFVIFSGIIFIFSAQMVAMAREYTDFIEKLSSMLDTSVNFLNARVQVIPDINSEMLVDRLSKFFTDSGLVIVSDTISLTSTFFSYIILTTVYTFLILLYARHLTDASTNFNRNEDKSKFIDMLIDVQQVGQKYLTGMVTLIGILGVLNSIGLLIIGIDYAFFFGFLAALLSIIPYVGTTLGGLIPTLYALIAYDSYWYPIGVIIVFWIIQLLEGNFLNPKIVGGNLRINALFSVFSLIAGGVLWGIPGMILSLPMIAVLKAMSKHYKELRPLYLLLDDPTKSESTGLSLRKRVRSWLKRSD